jgi:dTDP-4-dehydrorhamnose reductase
MRILVTGGSGRLGSTLLERLEQVGQHEVVAWSGATADADSAVPFHRVELTDGHAVIEALEADNPEAVIHAAALSSADAVYRDPTRGRDVNVEATRRLADWADSRRRRLLFTSTDMVFDGSRSWYREDDKARPVLAYGRTKLEAEAHVLPISNGLVARLSLLYGPNPSGRPGFFDLALEALRGGELRAFFRDEFRTPLDYRTAADALIRLVESDAVGIVHVGGRERVSRYELMQRAAVVLGLDPTLVRPGSQVDAILPEPRPADASLETSRLTALCPALERPSIEAALASPAA